MQRMKIANRARQILQHKPGREHIAEKCGDAAFLLPSERKFPIVSPFSGGCKPDCKMLHAAYVRAKQWSYNEIAGKAEAMLKSNDCDKKLGIKSE